MMMNNSQDNNMSPQMNFMKKPMSSGNLTDINDKYKTERCRHFETHKNCALGDKCHFAHGDKELRKPGDPLNPEQY